MMQPAPVEDEKERERESAVLAALRGMDSVILALQADDDDDDPIESLYAHSRAIAKENAEHERREHDARMKLIHDMSEANRAKKNGGKK